jgi:hypothetical protein
VETKAISALDKTRAAQEECPTVGFRDRSLVRLGSAEAWTAGNQLPGQVCDEIDPNCLLVGEMIHGNYNNWVGNDRLHSGTNYQLSRAIWNCLNEANYDELMTALLREYKLYGGITLLNFLGNHDVARIASMCAPPQAPTPTDPRTPN